jgi:hypothetical protein
VLSRRERADPRAQLLRAAVLCLDVAMSRHRGATPARSVTQLLVALLALLACAAAIAAAPAGALELGISDSDSTTLAEPFWGGLGISRARVVVPYDVATTSGDAGTQRRTDFERYRAAAAAAGVGLLVVFGPSADVRAPGTGDPVAPSVGEFAAAFSAFHASYPDVTTIAPWNEPNNRDATGYPLGSDPRLAADYWLTAKTICATCMLLAGDFAGIPGDDAYVDAYQGELAAGGAVPDVWAFHAYTDVNRFQVVGASDAPVTRYYLSKLQGPWAGARVWIDEVGARYRDTSGVIWGDASQRDAAGLLLGLATLDPRIDAIYYFNYSNRCATAAGCAVQDRGLVSPAPLNGDAPDYDAPNRMRPAYHVLGARGPLIAPVAALPPAVTIDAPAQGAALRSATPTFSGRAAETVNSDPTVRVQVFPGAGETEGSVALRSLTSAVASGRWSATSGRLRDGIYSVRASQAGNPGTSGISEDVVFTIDTVAPATAITSGPGATSGAHEQPIAFAASEPGVTFTCSRDGRRSAPCSSPMTLRHLTLGRHAFAVRARDAAGNPQRRPTRISWQVVSLASALAPRLAGIAQTLASGLPLSAACEDRCRVSAQLALAGRRGGGVVLARTVVRRTRAGVFALRLRPRGGAAAALAARSSASARLTIALRARGARTVTASATIALVRSGALRALARGGLPATLVCSSACSTAGARRVNAGAARLALPLARRSRARLHGHARSVTLPLTAEVGGPGIDPRTLRLSLTLPR